MLLWGNTHIQRVFHHIASQSMYKENSHHVLVFVPCIYIVLQCACIDNTNNALSYAFHLFVFETNLLSKINFDLRFNGATTMNFFFGAWISSFDSLKFGGVFYASHWQTCSPPLIYSRQLRRRIFFSLYIFFSLLDQMGSRIPWKGKLNMQNRRLHP